jgi:hypothetical protein
MLAFWTKVHLFGEKPPSLPRQTIVRPIAFGERGILEVIELIVEGADHRTNMLALVAHVGDRKDRLVGCGLLFVSNAAQRHDGFSAVFRTTSMTGSPLISLSV